MLRTTWEPQSIVSQGTMEREWKIWKNDIGRKAHSMPKTQKKLKNWKI